MNRRDFFKVSTLGLLGMALSPIIKYLPKERERPKTEEWLVEKAKWEPTAISVNGTPSYACERIEDDIVMNLGNVDDLGYMSYNEPIIYETPDIDYSINMSADSTDLIMQYDDKELSLKKMANRLKEIEDKVWG